MRGTWSMRNYLLSPRNLFGWQDKAKRPLTLAILRSWPELKTTQIAATIFAMNGGARGPWILVRRDNATRSSPSADGNG